VPSSLTAREQIAKSEKTHEESVNRITALTSELEQTRITVITYEGKIQELDGRVSELEARTFWSKKPPTRSMCVVWRQRPRHH
jgi:rubrerythrin